MISGRIKQLDKVSLNVPTTLTVIGGAITVTKSFHKVTSPTTGTTNLITINGGQQSDVLVLMAFDDARTITLKDVTGNLALAGNCNLDSIRDTITLLYDNGLWVELCRSNN